jgi:hypothetical protein
MEYVVPFVFLILTDFIGFITSEVACTTAILNGILNNDNVIIPFSISVNFVTEYSKSLCQTLIAISDLLYGVPSDFNILH